MTLPPSQPNLHEGCIHWGHRRACEEMNHENLDRFYRETEAAPWCVFWGGIAISLLGWLAMVFYNDYVGLLCFLFVEHIIYN